jgi:hypothetical protein
MGLGELILKSYDEYDDAMKKELISNIVESSRSLIIYLIIY